MLADNAAANAMTMRTDRSGSACADALAGARTSTAQNDAAIHAAATHLCRMQSSRIPPFTNGRSYVDLRCSVYHRLRKAQPCSLREWDGRTWKKLERAKGFEPSTPTLARLVQNCFRWLPQIDVR